MPTTIDNKKYIYVDIIGNEIHVGDYVACAVNPYSMEIRNVVGVRGQRLLVSYFHGSTTVHPAQCIKVRPEDATMYVLRKENEDHYSR